MQDVTNNLGGEEFNIHDMIMRCKGLLDVDGSNYP